TLFIYQYSVFNNYNEELTRSMVFTTLIFANIFLTLVNRSFVESVFTTLRSRNNLLTGVVIITLLMLGAILYFPPFTSFFKIAALDMNQLVWTILTAVVVVGWFEVYKWVRFRVGRGR